MCRVAPILLALLVATPALAGDTWTNPHPGMRRLHRTTTSPVWNINALEVDLTNPAIHFGATPYSQKAKRTSAFATSVGAQAAINADFYNGSYVTIGLAIGNGAAWPGTSDESSRGTLAFDDARRVELSKPSDVVTTEAWMHGLVSGHPGLVEGGVAKTFTDTFCTARHPRTAIGMSQDGHKLYLAVIDGRQSASIGMTCRETADLLVGLGAWRALNLDGGGSSTMWIAGTGIVNKPSDGSERVVANHLVVFSQPSQPSETGELIGVVYRAPNSADRLPGATVTLQDGRTTVADSTGVYRFQLPSGTWTATGTYAGYEPKSLACTLVAPTRKWCSLALVKPNGPVDGDGDGVADGTDNCVEQPNTDQLDTDGDHTGDACDGDDDGDGVYDEDDDCALVANATQADVDADGLGDACDPTDDRPAEPVDAGPAEIPDAGPAPEDAGNEVVDAGPEVVDAGMPIVDAGTPPEPDAGASIDAGTPVAIDPEPESGCATSAIAGFAILGLIALGRRKIRILRS